MGDAYQRCLQNLEHGRGSEDVAPLWFCKCLYKRRRINENMVWTDSQDYGADEILYTIGTVLFNINNRLMREITILFGASPQMFMQSFFTFPLDAIHTCPPWFFLRIRTSATNVYGFKQIPKRYLRIFNNLIFSSGFRQEVKNENSLRNIFKNS